MCLASGWRIDDCCVNLMTRPAIEGFGWWWHCQQLKAWRRCGGIVNKSRLFCFNHTGSCHDEGVDYGGSPEIPMTLSKHVTCVEDDDDLVKTILWNTSQRRWICSLGPGQKMRTPMKAGQGTSPSRSKYKSGCCWILSDGTSLQVLRVDRDDVNAERSLSNFPRSH